MKYIEARDLIQSGDIIGIEGRTRASGLTRLVQKLGGLEEDANCTHLAIAWWLEGRLYLVEMDGKYNVLRPLSQYKTNIRWWKCPADKEAMRFYFDAMTQDLVHYSMLDNISIGLRLLFGINPKDSSGENCSDFVVRWLALSGFDMCLPYNVSPAEVSKSLGKYQAIDNKE